MAKSSDEENESEDSGDKTALASTRAPANPGRSAPKKTVSAPRPPTTSPAAAPEPEDSGGGPSVTIRKPTKPRVERALLKENTAALEILWGDRSVTAGEVAEQIPSAVRRVLDAWADDILALELRVCLSGNPDHVVMGRARDEVLIDAPSAWTPPGRSWNRCCPSW